ncbi:TPA: threonylcarbamoyl-AMP synthase [Streptococcus pyogenes]|uniref:L-threonylcarbamoyladenylate synthase n=1 Tax=Streptococcus pyogenes TaxID=1314 RepID=UPI0003C7BD03|nr:L-threonylcarbamoyladenylate synthase [Streptococcus pyogenes]ESU85290.1 tRNA threonylcarbamoyl adenosine modification protein, Sua5/YciO/YrdC/YwlC family [Streptococcus pyogenes GA03799]ASO69300.1 threonylcarbamoyl-AMP synthase [Streptococcus pyogenes]ASO75014.1 threonylcarbamoyl-AMP synthase [Streptococcus pyogenes]OAC48723.1 tRNA threonylcarbamoyl adenosine modification protein [Streptococcus pyogenes]OAC51563.1 tRNA threonylcarbamoyl adenosine modification protein [Streptococcus pyogene
MEYLASIIESGDALVLPTETVYGLFAKALDEKAVNAVYDLKQRPRDKAMNLNVADFNSILAFSKEQPRYLKKLYQAFLPGPLTIILKANDQVPYWINSGLSTVGFRLPSHPITAALIQKTGPLIGPSANLSGKASGRVFDHIMQDFDFQVFGYADDPFLTGKDSTILDLSGERAVILRQGAITKEELLANVPELCF